MVLPGQLILGEVHLLRHRPSLKTKFISNRAPFLPRIGPCPWNVMTNSRSNLGKSINVPNWGNPRETFGTQQTTNTPSWLSAVLYQPAVTSVTAGNVSWEYELTFVLLILFFLMVISSYYCFDENGNIFHARILSLFCSF